MACPAKHPLHPTSNCYKKAIVRACCDRLREIEGRLEQSVGPRFEQQLQSCDDLCGVARLILMLQRRTELRDTESGWLEELAQLSPAELDENPPKLALQLRKRLEELRSSVRPEVAPSSLIGATVLRRLDGATQGVHKGVVIEHDEWTGFRVLYTDGDCEDLTLRELKATLLRSGVEAAPEGAEEGEEGGATEGAPRRRSPVEELAGAGGLAGARLGADPRLGTGLANPNPTLTPTPTPTPTPDRCSSRRRSSEWARRTASTHPPAPRHSASPHPRARSRAPRCW